MILDYRNRKKHYCLSEYYIDKENARWHMRLWFSGEVRVPAIQKI